MSRGGRNGSSGTRSKLSMSAEEVGQRTQTSSTDTGLFTPVTTVGHSPVTPRNLFSHVTSGSDASASAIRSSISSAMLVHVHVDPTKCPGCSKKNRENQMIGCDRCGQWAHYDCEGLKEKEFKNFKSSTKYLCVRCRAPRVQRYK